MPSWLPSWYRLAWPVISRLDPEKAHGLALSVLKSGVLNGDTRRDPPILASTVWGRSFPNPVGLAAGFDKDGVAVGPLFGLGFGFVEVGTVTPRPQPGNPAPRLFRLAEDKALINRMGFNNQGIERLRARLSQPRRPGMVGVNLGKNKDTEDAAADYERGMACLAPVAGYVVINVSSPNTPGLRALQGREPLQALVGRARRALDLACPDPAKRPPLLLKIAPDLTDDDLADIAAVARGDGTEPAPLDGLICTNTTLARPEFLKSPLKGEAGGLSGAPLQRSALDVLRRVYSLTEGRVPLIGVGGITTGADAYARLRAGASLVQVYSALIYEGPGLVRRIKEDLIDCLKKDGFTSVAEAVGADHR
ncbi:quinone-dependent dihydroorotate dehydrogenase [Pararhodospirillum photometricum]|uniref:Dihydroorotate dehydrogenase (quinone) n=1 Tax=Pararhodospirillum photometricum DSM 122 TaxID=1150469 RepID=H6SJK9_PARPM|nr:quinone-dependent dihydroorotate dehydrogenase [Pararhodospirillum photometricum]CCG08174.1 Dihydroorotate dehydrogenase [Pararhodospirillum photometricum DSM 122]